MFKNIVGSVLLVLCLFMTNPGLYAYEDGDFQIWHTEGQDVNLKKGAKLLVEEEFRYGDSAGELYYQHYDVGLAYDVNKYLTTSINYRQIYEGEKGKFKPEYEPHLNITPKCELYGFKIEDRNRFALKLYDDKREDIVQYRNRLLVRAPWKFTPLGIQPYVSDEVFVKLNNAAWNRNRFAVGVTLDLLKNIKGDIYYMLQSTKKPGRWTDANILGLKLKALF
ncbi:MAG: DUF2490 domain-containing protein [Candidatus Omnitrophica bacterium]|nr:DUF2490 domain-containing protein [Candidatus Omnitrophota bacterium]